MIDLRMPTSLAKEILASKAFTSISRAPKGAWTFLLRATTSFRFSYLIRTPRLASFWVAKTASSKLTLNNGGGGVWLETRLEFAVCYSSIWLKPHWTIAAALFFLSSLWTSFLLFHRAQATVTTISPNSKLLCLIIVTYHRMSRKLWNRKLQLVSSNLELNHISLARGQDQNICLEDSTSSLHSLQIPSSIICRWVRISFAGKISLQALQAKWCTL